MVWYGFGVCGWDRLEKPVQCLAVVALRFSVRFVLVDNRHVHLLWTCFKHLKRRSLWIARVIWRVLGSSFGASQPAPVNACLRHIQCEESSLSKLRSSYEILRFFRVKNQWVSPLEISWTIYIWSTYSDLTRPHPKWFSKGNSFISGNSRLVKYHI